MNRNLINRATFGTCLSCLGVGVVLALASIWGDVDSKLFWKLANTTSVLFVFSLLTAIVNRCISE